MPYRKRASTKRGKMPSRRKKAGRSIKRSTHMQPRQSGLSLYQPVIYPTLTNAYHGKDTVYIWPLGITPRTVGGAGLIAYPKRNVPRPMAVFRASVAKDYVMAESPLWDGGTPATSGYINGNVCRAILPSAALGNNPYGSALVGSEGYNPAGWARLAANYDRYVVTRSRWQISLVVAGSLAAAASDSDTGWDLPTGVAGFPNTVLKRDDFSSTVGSRVGNTELNAVRDTTAAGGLNRAGSTNILRIRPTGKPKYVWFGVTICQQQQATVVGAPPNQYVQQIGQYVPDTPAALPATLADMMIQENTKMILVNITDAAGVATIELDLDHAKWLGGKLTDGDNSCRTGTANTVIQADTPVRGLFLVPWICPVVNLGDVLAAANLYNPSWVTQGAANSDATNFNTIINAGIQTMACYQDGFSLIPAGTDLNNLPTQVDPSIYCLHSKVQFDCKFYNQKADSLADAGANAFVGAW
jgi:hypothetical protein